MVNRCCIIHCKNNSRTSKALKFYSFPVSKFKERQREEWILAINRNNPDGTLWMPTKKSDRICSAHFFGNVKSDNVYSTNYVPTLFLSSNEIQPKDQQFPSQMPRKKSNLNNASTRKARRKRIKRAHQLAQQIESRNPAQRIRTAHAQESQEQEIMAMEEVPRIRVRDFGALKNMKDAEPAAGEGFNNTIQPSPQVPVVQRQVILCPAGSVPNQQNMYFTLVPNGSTIQQHIVTSTTRPAEPMVTVQNTMHTLSNGIPIVRHCQRTGMPIPNTNIQFVAPNATTDQQIFSTHPIVPSSQRIVRPVRISRPYRTYARRDTIKTKPRQQVIRLSNPQLKKKVDYLYSQEFPLKKCSVKLKDINKYQSNGGPSHLPSSSDTSEALDSFTNTMQALSSKFKEMSSFNCPKCKALVTPSNVWVNVQSHEIACQKCVSVVPDSQKKKHSLDSFINDVKSAVCDIWSDSDEDDLNLSELSKLNKPEIFTLDSESE